VSLPGDVTTFTLSFGSYTNILGATALAGLRATITPVDAQGRDVRLTHVSTGRAIVPEPVEVTIASDGTGSIGLLPHTDNATLSPAEFLYKVEWNVSSRSPTPGNAIVAVPAASGTTIDYDLLVPVASAAPVSVVLPSVVSVAGYSGAVTGAQLADDVELRAAFVPKGNVEINALDYLDGVRTDTQAINAAITAASGLYATWGSYITVYVPPKSGGWEIKRATAGVNVGGGIELKRGVKLRGDHTKLQLGENCYMIYAASPEGYSSAVTANTTPTDTSLTVADSSGYQIGDTVYVRLGQHWYDAIEPDYWFFAKVVAIPDATHVTLDRTVGYTMNVADVASTDRRRVTVLTSFLEQVDIEGFDLHSTGLTPQSTEAGIHLWKVGTARVANVTGRNMGAGIIFSFFVDNLETDNLRILGSVSPNGRDTWGRGLNLAETRVAHLRNTYAENLDRNFATIESTCEAIRFTGVKIQLNSAAFLARNIPVFRNLGNSRVEYQDLFIQGQCNSLFDDSGNALEKATFRFTNTSIRTSTLPIIKDLSVFDGDLRIGDTVYREVRKVSRTFPITPGMSNAFVDLPSGLARRLRIYASTTTGITTMYINNGVQNGTEIAPRLVAGQTVPIVNVCGLSPVGTNYKWNDFPTKRLRINTDGTVPAGAYITVDFEYFAIPGTTDDGSAGRADLSTIPFVGVTMADVAPLSGVAALVGKWYATAPSAIATGIPPESFERAVPIRVARDCTIDQLAVGVTVVGSAGAVIRLGVRADNNGAPGTLLVDAGTVDGTATGTPTATLGTPLALTAGTRVWLTAVVQGAATTRPTVRQNTATTPLGGIGADTATLALDTALTGYQGGAGVTGAFPSTQGTWTQTNVATRIAAHISA
jgi:hypothetical protein